MSDVYLSKSGSKWHLSPLCRFLGTDWDTKRIEWVLKHGFSCCPICAKHGYAGILYTPASGYNYDTTPPKSSGKANRPAKI